MVVVVFIIGAAAVDTTRSVVVHYELEREKDAKIGTRAKQGEMQKQDAL